MLKNASGIPGFEVLYPLLMEGLDGQPAIRGDRPNGAFIGYGKHRAVDNRNAHPANLKALLLREATVAIATLRQVACGVRFFPIAASKYNLAVQTTGRPLLDGKGL